MTHIKEKLGISDLMLSIFGIIVIFSIACFIGEDQTEDQIRFEAKITIKTKDVEDFKALEAEEVKVVEVERRPLKFQKFKVTLEVTIEKPQDDDYVRSETNKLIGLATSLANDKNIKVIKLEGVSVRNNKTFDISLD